MGFNGGCYVVPFPSLEQLGSQLVRAIQDFVRDLEKFIQYIIDAVRGRLEG